MSVNPVVGRRPRDRAGAVAAGTVVCVSTALTPRKTVHLWGRSNVRLPHIFRLVLAGCLCVATWSAFADDAHVQRDLAAAPPFAGAHMTPMFRALPAELGHSCTLPPPNAPIGLFQAARYALCANPSTRQAWSTIQAQAAQIGESYSAYWPTLNAKWQRKNDHARSDIVGQSALSSDSNVTYNSESLSLSWVLYDFGARASATEHAKQMWLASKFSFSDAVQSTFLQTAKDFYAAEAAWASLGAARETQATAKRSLEIATIRVQHGVAAISDQLQAQTAYSQSVYVHAKLQGRYRSSLGALAIDMGLDPRRTRLKLISIDWLSLENANRRIGGRLRQLMHAAQIDNPKIAEARARHRAALANVNRVRDAGLPTIRMTWRYTTSDQPQSLGFGLQMLPSTNYDNYVGLELNVPLFEGFGRYWKVRKAQDQAVAQADALANARWQVNRSVWKAYEAYKTAAAALTNSQVVQTDADKALTAAQQRYAHGVAGILEVLNAQGNAADAREQHISAMDRLLAARLQLAYAIGTIGQPVLWR
jgi:outer membrane protein